MPPVTRVSQMWMPVNLIKRNVFLEMLYFRGELEPHVRKLGFLGGMFQVVVFILEGNQTEVGGRRRMNPIFLFVMDRAVFIVVQKHWVRKF